jgi:hypothetical protein
VTQRVYCAVRVEFLNKIRAEFRFQSAQAVSSGPLTADDRVRSKVSPCGICGGRSGIEKDFSPSIVVFPCQYRSTNAPYSSSSTCYPYQKDKRANPENLTKRNVLSLRGGALHRKFSFIFCLQNVKVSAIAHYDANRKSMHIPRE